MHSRRESCTRDCVCAYVCVCMQDVLCLARFHTHMHRNHTHTLWIFLLAAVVESMRTTSLNPTSLGCPYAPSVQIRYFLPNFFVVRECVPACVCVLEFVIFIQFMATY
eukprot:Opistho-2@26712